MTNVQTVNKFKMKKPNEISYKAKKFCFTQPRQPKEHSYDNFQGIIQEKKIYQTMIKQQLAQLENQQAQLYQQHEQKFLPEVKAFQVSNASTPIQKTDEQFRKCFQQLTNYNKSKQIKLLIKKLTQNKIKKSKSRAAQYFLYEKLVKKYLHIWKMECGFEGENNMNQIGEKTVKIQNVLKNIYSNDFIKNLKKVKVNICNRKYKKQQQFKNKMHLLVKLKKDYFQKKLVNQRIQLILLKRATMFLEFWSHDFIRRTGYLQKLSIIENIHKHRSLNQFRMAVQKNKEIHKIRRLFKIRSFPQNLRDYKSLVLPHEIRQSKYLVCEQQLKLNLTKSKAKHLLNNLSTNKKIKNVSTFLLTKLFCQFLDSLKEQNKEQTIEKQKASIIKINRKIYALNKMRQEWDFDRKINILNKKYKNVNFKNRFWKKDSLAKLQNHFKNVKAFDFAVKISHTIFQTSLKNKTIKALKQCKQNKTLYQNSIQQIHNQSSQQGSQPIQLQEIQQLESPKQHQSLFQSQNTKKLNTIQKEEQQEQETQDKWLKQQNQQVEKFNTGNLEQQQLLQKSNDQIKENEQIDFQIDHTPQQQSTSELKIKYLWLRIFFKKYHKNFIENQENTQKSELLKKILLQCKVEKTKFLFSELSIKVTSRNIQKYLKNSCKQSFIQSIKQARQTKLQQQQIHLILMKKIYPKLHNNKEITQHKEKIHQQRKSVQMIRKSNILQNIVKYSQLKQKMELLKSKIYLNRCEYFVKCLLSFLLSSRTVENNTIIQQDKSLTQKEYQQISLNQQNISEQKYDPQEQLQYISQQQQENKKNLYDIYQNQSIDKYFQFDDIDKQDKKDEQEQEDQEDDKDEKYNKKIEYQQQQQILEGNIYETQDVIDIQAQQKCQSQQESEIIDEQNKNQLTYFIKRQQLNKFLIKMEINLKIANLDYCFKRLSIFLTNSKKNIVLRKLKDYSKKQQFHKSVIITSTQKINHNTLFTCFNAMKTLISKEKPDWYAVPSQIHAGLPDWYSQPSSSPQNDSDNQPEQALNYITHKYEDGLKQKSLNSLKNLLITAKQQNSKNHDLKLRCFQGLSMFYHQKKLLKKYLEQCNDDSEEQLYYYPQNQQMKQQFDKLKQYQDASSNSSQQQY